MLRHIIFLLLPLALFSQVSDPRTDQYNFAPGELIVKLKDDVDTGITYKSTSKGISKTTTSKNIGILIGLDSKIESYEALFTEETVERSLKLAESYKFKKLIKKDPYSVDIGPKFEASLKNIFKIHLINKNEDIHRIIQDLKENKLVEYAEPNYRFKISDFNIDSEIIYDKDLPLSSTTTSTTPNDPLYSQQSNITQANIDDVWNEYTTGDGSQIVAILDTGVDYTHPDLEANIWINQAELNGDAGYDDDGNGYIDDIRGWDFHHNTNTPLDDNMHGTHVAGIVGAVGNNGIGIAGASWNVKLMAIKVFQASGIGDLSTIATGIEYAVNNGATILNMSFGGGITSITMYNTLANAYAGSKRFLVAAAGNNGLPLPPCIPGQIFYPAAYTFVFGVEAEGPFSNYDCDGPIFSTLLDQQNYETKAPGVSILSTVPNGGYRKLSGTSMSAPLVSGIVALYNQTKEVETNERKFGNLINTKTGTYIDALAAIKAEAQPILKLLTAQAVDSVSTNTYQDGQLDAGEEIDLYPTVKNYWGTAEKVKVELKLAGNEFSNQYYKSLIEIQDSIIELGTISDYAIYKQRENPLKFKISNNIAHNTQIEFRMVVWEDNGEDPSIRYNSKSKVDSLDFKLKVKNGIKLQGLIEKDTILSPKYEYIITNPLIVEGANLILKPGVTIRFGEDELTQQRGQILLYNKANKSAGIVAIGKKDSLITFKPDTYSYVGSLIMDNNGRNNSYSSDSVCDWCVFENMHVVYHPKITNSQFFGGGAYGGSIQTSNFIQSDGYLYSVGGWKNTNLVDFNSNGWQNIYYSPTELNILGWYRSEYNYIGNYTEISLNGFYANNNQDFEKIYLGTGSVNILKELNIDAFDGNPAGFFRYNNPRLTPYSEAPAIVWKVVVDGKNAWDEFEQMDPLGVGIHEFKIYFNKPVDTLVNPKIGYGVRDPWNSILISEEGTWNTEGTIYTVSHNLGILPTDGINRINVWGGKDLNGWDIPLEKRRFNILIQSAGSASTSFEASPGLGEITLDWTAPSEFDLNDVLGYNMYRYTANADGTFTNPIKVNQSLVTDVSFKDYDVVRNTQYFYKYKILRTSFEETDFSNAVSASLLTAALGDSNGDASVNVLDVVNTVNYILGTNPTPFVDYATDVNSDSAINVLDIVGIVNLILNPSTSSVRVNGSPINYYSNKATSKAKFYWDKNNLYLVNQESIGGIQLAFAEGFEYVLNQDISGFETLKYQQDKEEMLLLFALNENELKPGKHKILTRTTLNSDLSKAVLASKNGTPIDIEIYDIPLEIIKSPEQTDSMRILSFAPNPTDGPLDLYYYLPETVNQISVHVYDIYGNIVYETSDLKNTSGYSHIELDLSHLNSGIYLLSLNERSTNRTIKIIIK